MRRPLFLLLPLLLCACVTTSRPGRALPHPSPTVDPAMEVHNDHWVPVQVFLLWSGTRYFLGEVEPGRRDLFRIPRGLVTDGWVRFLVDPLGSTAEHETAPVQLREGRNVDLRLKKNLEASRVRVM